MKIKIGTAQTLLGGLMNLEKDEKTKLGDSRFPIAINIERLRPVVAAYESAAQKRMAEMLEDSAPEERELIQLRFAEADAGLRDEEVEIDLKTIERKGLKLDDNTRITGAMLAQIAPMISDFEG